MSKHHRSRTICHCGTAKPSTSSGRTNSWAPRTGSRQREPSRPRRSFVGHGIVNEQEKWDDYKGVDVKGKIVVLFTNEPQPDNPEVFKGRTLTYAGRWVYKFEEAARQGALGCLIIHTTPTAGYGWDVVRNSWSKEDPQMLLEPGQKPLAFAGWVTQAAGEKLLGLSDHTVDELLRAADSRDFRPIPLGVTLRGNLKPKIRKIESRNVLGMLPGSDAKLRNEYVMYSAHWDHLGIALPVNGDAIYNGAIDNATGVGVVLETARAFGALRQMPRRSVLFAFWTAEESGLRGAEYYSHHPLFPPAKTAVNINYDALFPSARTRDVVVSGAERTSAWTTVQEAARRYEFEIAPDPRPEQGSYYRSDHFMLARIGIPAFQDRPRHEDLWQAGQSSPTASSSTTTRNGTTSPAMSSVRIGTSRVWNTSDVSDSRLG